MKHDIYIGKNSAEVLDKLPARCVDSIFTSPPYYSKREYKDANADWKDGYNGQLGLESHPTEFIKHLTDIFMKCWRPLKIGGTMFINIGDTYCGAGNTTENDNLGILDYAKEDIPDKKPSNTVEGYEKKSMLMIPELLAMSLINHGWILRNKCIWLKVPCTPDPVNDRFTNMYEMVYFFVKTRKYYFNLDAVRERYTDETMKRIEQARKNKKDYQRGQGEFGIGRHPTTIMQGVANKNAPESVNLFNFKKGGLKGLKKAVMEDNIPMKNPGDVVMINIPQYGGGHFASFSKQLVSFFIKAGCPVGGTVLDPFLGTGTVSETAELEGMNSIGIDISNDYKQLMIERMNPYTTKLVNKAEVEFHE